MELLVGLTLPQLHPPNYNVSVGLGRFQGEGFIFEAGDGARLGDSFCVNAEQDCKCLGSILTYLLYQYYSVPWVYILVLLPILYAFLAEGKSNRFKRVEAINNFIKCFYQWKDLLSLKTWRLLLVERSFPLITSHLTRHSYPSIEGVAGLLCLWRYVLFIDASCLCLTLMRVVCT